MTKKRKNQHFDCADIETHLYAYIDGQLKDDELKMFEAHLEYCVPCEKKVEFDQKLKEIIKKKGKEKVHPAHIDSFLKQIISESGKHSI